MSDPKPSGWPHDFYSPEELAEFEELGRNFTPEQMAAYQKKWAELIVAVRSKLHLPPDSPEARQLAERWQQLLQEGFAGHEKLLPRIAQAYQQGAVPRQQSRLDPEILDFIKKTGEAATRPKDQKQEK
ncbi:MAG: TipAS antibiotic-recognition domain-containing protein [Candidatus Saccharicenans sp.]|nr:TipAS antibiotic-recognition domain-containing protein [Candidatus Saccharicenans sp.]MDH7493128.1 TipAS antibiotic-recognition domain-containing protein [Candidatus Saccharicenans sp.]